MSVQLWQEPPTVPLLQWLSRGPLKQNLLQAIRLWVWLHLLYGEAGGKAGQTLGLIDPFTYADWRDRFFSATHPTDEKKPRHGDPACTCNKTTAAWLFAPGFHLTQPEWEAYAQTHTAEIQTQLHQFTRALKAHNQLPSHLTTLLDQPLFGMTRRTLYSDLRVLASISWLNQQGQNFYRVAHWPDTPQTEGKSNLAAGDTIAFLTQPDLAAIAENLSREIQGDRRFFVHVDYVIPQHKLDRVDDWQTLLCELWQRSPVPPVSLHYHGAGQPHSIAIVAYPVCIYYFRRGPYLCAYGQVPNADPNHLDWRNYRLDRLSQITALPWAAPEIPPALSQLHQAQTLPHPDEIAIRMEDTWGFDYYRPVRVLLVRFDQVWDDRYIKDTVRHNTFKRVPYSHAQKLIHRHLSGEDQQALLHVIAARSAEDAYYTAFYREGDPNIHQRLRAWRPHIEVLLPWPLRQQFAAEVQREYDFYSADQIAQSTQSC